MVAAFLAAWTGGVQTGPAGLGQATPTLPEGLCPLAEPECEPGAESGASGATPPIDNNEAGRSQVRAVLFWMEGCPRCDEVVNSVLPPLYERYGEALYVRMEEVVGLEEVEKLFDVGERLGMRKEEIGVPILLIGDQVLAGSDEIGRHLPRLVERGMKGVGIDFPEVPEFGIAPVTDARRLDSGQPGRWFVIIGAAMGFTLTATIASLVIRKRNAGKKADM